MKLSLRHPSGLEIDFDGNGPEFESFTKFIVKDLSGFVNGLSRAPAADSDKRLLPPGKDKQATTADGPDLAVVVHDNVISPHAVSEQITRIGANTDIARITVMAQAAVDAGLEGIDFATAEQLYGDLGIRKPLRFPKAFSNAKTRGLVKNVKRGVWAPTVQGENYARYGEDASRRKAKRGPKPAESASGGGPSGE